MQSAPQFRPGPLRLRDFRSLSRARKRHMGVGLMPRHSATAADGCATAWCPTFLALARLEMEMLQSSSSRWWTWSPWRRSLRILEALRPEISPLPVHLGARGRIWKKPLKGVT